MTRCLNTAYDAVASVYDRHWGREFSEAAKAAFDTLLLPLLPQGAAVLDVCCGTGLVLAHLDQLTFSTTGVDESANMLAIARHNAPRARLLQADMADFAAGSQFPAILSFYNSLNHARSLDHLRATLVNVANHLRSDGFFLFDYVLPEAFETEWECCDETNDDCTVQYSYERSSGHAICLIDQRHEIRQIIIQPQEMCDALCAAGLNILREIPMTGVGPVTGRQLVLAKKQ